MSRHLLDVWRSRTTSKSKKSFRNISIGLRGIRERAGPSCENQPRADSASGLGLRSLSPLRLSSRVSRSTADRSTVADSPTRDRRSPAPASTTARHRVRADPLRQSRRRRRCNDRLLRIPAQSGHSGAVDARRDLPHQPLAQLTAGRFFADRAAGRQLDRVCEGIQGQLSRTVRRAAYSRSSSNSA
jgi:hypothetical protein